LFGQSEAKKKKRKKCARAGQKTGKKRKKCCSGLVRDGSGVCAKPQSGCTPATCPPTACGSLPDGCGSTLSCGCQANQICLRRGVCQPCTVTCTGTPKACGTALQSALNGGGTIYVCPGRYQGGFALNTAVTVIGAGEGTDAVSNTILDANDLGSVLHVGTAVGLVELERLRITDGSERGIRHDGTALRMTDCTVSGNTIVDGVGGGIGVGGGTLEMLRCTVRDNHATGSSASGGGIYTIGTTTLTDCLVEDNRAGVDGGGLFVSINAGTCTLAGSTQVRDNAATFGGGISLQLGTLVIAETCRVTENTAPPGQGGGIYNVPGNTVTLQGADPASIVVNNCRENCVGSVPSCAATPVSCPP
jgi:Right handed beta helix region